MNAATFINNVLGETIDQIVNGKENLPASEKSKLKDDVPFDKANFFTWCTPGVPVNPQDFAFLKGLRKPINFEKWKDLPEAQREEMRGDATHTLTVAMDNFSLLVDTVPNKDGMVNSLQVWEPQNRISHIYESVLRNSEVADTVPSPDAEERIKKIRADLVETVEKVDADTGEKFTEERPSKLIVAYNKYAEEYLTAYGKYVDLMTGAVNGNAAAVQKASMLGPQTYKTVTTAYDMWESQGQKSKYEKMVADLAQLEGVSMSLLKREYLDIFNRSKRTSLIDFMDYNVARLVPAGFYDSGGWTDFSFSSSKLKTTDLSKTSKQSGGASYGFFGGASASHQKLDTSDSINFEGASMSFQLCQVPIVRSWFREDYLTSTKWRLKTQADAGSAINPGEILSNGNSANPAGKLFAYPTVIMFARNIKVTKTLYDKLSTEANRSGGGGGGFSLGPFSCGGKASFNKTERQLQVTRENDSMVVEGMQIIGFRNHIMPMCPNPDPNIKKWI